MTILCQDEVAHPNCIRSFEGFHYRWNNPLHTRAREDPLMAKAVDHIDAKESYTSLRSFPGQIAPGDARQIACPFHNGCQKFCSLLQNGAWNSRVGHNTASFQALAIIFVQQLD